MKLDDLKKYDNIAQYLDNDLLEKLGQQVVNGYNIDVSSLEDWKKTIDGAMKIAKQVVEEKTHPWPGASNIKYPLISQASIDFAARTMPEIINNDKVIKIKILGNTTEDQEARAARIEQFTSYQLIHSSDEWEKNTDKLLQILPVLGVVFKKTYFNPIEKRVVSELCIPDKIVLNYATTSLETARRITHIICLSSNDIIERQRKGLFTKDVDVETLRPSGVANDDDFMVELLEQHCYLDLDEDGYKEPYIVTVHEPSRQVLRIVNRFGTIEKNRAGEIEKITPLQYFTDFHFIPALDGGFYSMGFGSLLLPLNSAINTIMNQLVDAGTLANTQGGLIGRGIRLKNGEFNVKMNEWKVVDSASGTDLAKNVFPFPVREPSSTLFNLLGLLMQIGRDLTSTNEALQGKQAAQNVASGVMNELVEQGTKVFSAINKRLYRSLRKEYRWIFALNKMYLPNTEYRKVVNDPKANVKFDFNLDDADVLPVSDPILSSTGQKLMKAQMVQQLRSIDVREADYYLLSNLQIDETTIKKLLPEPDPNAPPPPDVQKLNVEMQMLQAQIAKLSADATLAAEQNAMKSLETKQAIMESESRIHESMARVWKMQKDASHGDAKIMIAGGKMKQQADLQAATLMHKQQKDGTDSSIKAAKVINDRVQTEIDAQLEAAKIAKEKGEE